MKSTFSTLLYHFATQENSNTFYPSFSLVNQTSKESRTSHLLTYFIYLYYLPFQNAHARLLATRSATLRSIQQLPYFSLFAIGASKARLLQLSTIPHVQQQITILLHIRLCSFACHSTSLRENALLQRYCRQCPC